MKILHSADWHLDAPLTGLPDRETMKQHLLSLPDAVCRVCHDHGCDLVLLAGDLFDGLHTPESYRAAYRAIEEMQVPVVITPGNHDPLTNPVWDLPWPSNVRLATRRVQAFHFPTRNCTVWAGAFESMDCPSLLKFLPEDTRGHIGVFHGDPLSPNSPYNPVTPDMIRKCGFSYLALGHIHKSGRLTYDDTLCAWPGCPMGRGWDETGEKGVLIYDTEDQSLQFVALDFPKFHDLTYDCGEEFESPLSALCDLLPKEETRDYYRVTLTGTAPEGAWAGLADRFPHIPHLQVRDRTEPPLDLWQSLGQDTLEGVLFGLLKGELEDASPENRDMVLEAAKICRRLLDGREVTL